MLHEISDLKFFKQIRSLYQPHSVMYLQYIHMYVLFYSVTDSSEHHVGINPSTLLRCSHASVTETNKTAVSVCYHTNFLSFNVRMTDSSVATPLSSAGLRSASVVVMERHSTSERASETQHKTCIWDVRTV